MATGEVVYWLHRRYEDKPGDIYAESFIDYEPGDRIPGGTALPYYWWARDTGDYRLDMTDRAYLMGPGSKTRLDSIMLLKGKGL